MLKAKKICPNFVRILKKIIKNYHFKMHKYLSSIAGANSILRSASRP